MSQTAPGVNCRLVEAEPFRAYLDSIPDDGETMAPTSDFCDRGPRFLGFPAGEITDMAPDSKGIEVTLSCWFPCFSLPTEYEVEVASIQVRAMRLDSRLDITPAFLEVPSEVWDGFPRVVLIGYKALAVASGINRLFRGYLDSINAT